MRKLLLKTWILGFLFGTTSLMAQLVVNADDFARNPSRYNGRQIVIRNVSVNKGSSSIQLSGPHTLSGNSPQAIPSRSAPSRSTQIQTSNTPTTVQLNANTSSTGISINPSTTSPTSNSRCTPPKNWEIITVEIPNYNGCFVMYTRMAKTIPAGRKLTADLTFFVDTNLMNRITRVKLIP